jgi:hypothetical protein
MERRRLAVRILGIAPTSHGYAFAVAEGPEQLADWARCDLLPRSRLEQRLTRLIDRTRPLFVAAEVARNQKQSTKSRAFNKALKAVCAREGVMILCVQRHKVYAPDRGARPVTNHEIASAAAERFPEIANKLPTRRRLWHGRDDGIGILLAAALAAAGWKHFRKRP